MFVHYYTQLRQDGGDDENQSWLDSTDQGVSHLQKSKTHVLNKSNALPFVSMCLKQHGHTAQWDLCYGDVKSTASVYRRKRAR